MAKKFVLTGEQEGSDLVINNRYSFVGGEMPVSDSDAEKIKPILCGFYACELQDIADEVIEEENVDKDSSLQKSVTSK